MTSLQLADCSNVRAAATGNARVSDVMISTYCSK